jgi:hypothetical protein
MTLAEVSTLLTREPPVAAGGIPVTQDLGAFPIRLRTIRTRLDASHHWRALIVKFFIIRRSL